VIFFTRHGKDSVRMVVPGMEGRRQAEKLRWGLKLKLDVKKPVIGLAAHPREQQIVALFGDGALRGYVLGQGGLAPTFTLPGGCGGRAAANTGVDGARLQVAALPVALSARPTCAPCAGSRGE
jgi:hypothetical protein